MAGALGLLVRVSFILLVTSKQTLAGDSWYYFHQAKAVAAGRGFENPYLTLAAGRPIPGAEHPPAYTVFLAAVQAVGFRSVTEARLATSVLGMIAVVLLGFAGRELAGRRAGICVALCAALYPPLWITDGLLMSESLYVLTWAAALVCFYRFVRTSAWVWYLGLVLSLAVCVATRAEAVLVLVIVCGILLVKEILQEGLRRSALLLALTVAVPVLVLGPWVAYNSTRFSQPVIVSDQFGPTLAASNCDATYSGELLGSIDPKCGSVDVVDKNGELTRNLDGSEIDVALRKHALHYLWEHKRELPKVVLAREARFVGVWRVRQQWEFAQFVEGRGSGWLVRMAYFGYVVYLLAAVGGVVRMWPRRGLLLPLAAQVLASVLVVAMTTGSLIRYRAGVDVCIAVLAGVGVAALLERVTGRPEDSNVVDRVAELDREI